MSANDINLFKASLFKERRGPSDDVQREIKKYQKLSQEALEAKQSYEQHEAQFADFVKHFKEYKTTMFKHKWSMMEHERLKEIMHQQRKDLIFMTNVFREKMEKSLIEEEKWKTVKCPICMKYTLYLPSFCKSHCVVCQEFIEICFYKCGHGCCKSCTESIIMDF